MLSILEIHYAPSGIPTHRFGKVKQCDPRETRTPDLAFPVPCYIQLCHRANRLARWFDTCWSPTEALTPNWSLCFSFSNLWEGPRYFKWTFYVKTNKQKFKKVKKEPVWLDFVYYNHWNVLEKCFSRICHIRDPKMLISGFGFNYAWLC